jgi:thiol-disulfide isomerase/thioredoxin
MKYILIIIAIIAIIGGLFYSFTKNEEELVNEQTNTSRVRPLDEKREAGDIIKESDDGDGVIIEEEDGFGNDLADGTTEPGEYLDYDASLLSRADDGDVVLFFHAGWCPTCKALERDIKNNMSDIPEDLTILKLNYDKESELKKKYAVVIQHTLIQVDSSGNEITKWTGGNDLDSVISRLK